MHVASKRYDVRICGFDLLSNVPTKTHVQNALSYLGLALTLQYVCQFATFTNETEAKQIASSYLAFNNKVSLYIPMEPNSEGHITSSCS